MAKAVVKKESSAVALVDERPEYVNPETARGNEAVGIQDLVIPRIDVIQALSPQRKKSDPTYIEGAEEGMLFNTVTGMLYGTGMTVVPVIFRKEYIIWKDRKSGGGYRGAFKDEDTANGAMRNLEDGALCEVIETAQHFCIIIPDDGPVDDAVISMSRSKMKASRNLNTLVQMAGNDRWSRAYRMDSIEVDGAKGEYWSIQFKQLGYVPKDIFERGEKMYEAVRAGARDVDRTDHSAGAGTPGDEPDNSPEVGEEF